MNKVWIIDDDRSIRWVLEKALSREDIPFRSFDSATEALAELDHSSQPPAVMLSDIRMPGASGLELLQKVKLRHAQLPVIIMTAFSDLDSAVSSFQGGAFEYLPKPFDIDQALALIRRALAQGLQQNAAAAEAVLAPEILGQAAAMQVLFRAIGRLAHSHATVLINGESGTGKELVALALHRHSPRCDAPFIAINTAAIPRDLLESELFGHERGAFTGATALRERREDIPLLLRHFLRKSAHELGVECKRVADTTVDFLQHQPFPGNVRQLENLCHWLTVMAPAQVVEIADLPAEMREQPARALSASWIDGLRMESDHLLAVAPGRVFEQLTRAFERTLIERALSATCGRRIEAAQLLGIGRNTISRKIHELGMQDERKSSQHNGDAEGDSH